MVFRILRIIRLGARLTAGELRRGPQAFIDMARHALMTMFGRSSLDRTRGSVVVDSISRAETAATTADESGAAGPRKGRWERIVGSFITQFGLGLVRQGHVTDAAWLLQTYAERHPDHARLTAAAGVVDGERRVLSGEWRPPPAARRTSSSHEGRILHIVGKSLPQTLAGYTVRTQSIVTSQRATGLEPEVVTRIGFPWYVGGEAAGAIEEIEGIRYHRIGSSDVPPRWDDRLDANLAALAPIVEAVQPEILHAHSDFENALLALGLRDRFDLPVVYEVRGFWEETWLSGSPERRPGADRFRLRHEREVACAAAADRVVTLADPMKRRLVAAGVDPDRIAIVPNAVDPARFPVVGGDLELTAALGIQAGDTVIGYVSSLVPYEGVDTLLRAAAAMVAAGDPIRVLIVGDGSARSDLERLAKRLRLGGRAIFTGRVPHDRVLDYYGLIDVFVVPRRDDRVCRLVTPLKPFEAMATGTALVMSGVEALRDIADASQAAATFRPEDHEDLAAVLRPLVADPDARRVLGTRGREWVTRERTWGRNAQRYLDLYREIGRGR
jgi:glycosyltransferase involved in cell wall biosynthesis